MGGECVERVALTGRADGSGAGTVILANGDFPRKGSAARRMLEAATRVVACDGAADAYRRKTGRVPTLTVGDLDSLSPGARRGGGGRVLRIAEQDTNDLEKAVRVCREKGWGDLVILGATGRREDHTLGNVFRALDLGVEVVSDYGRFIPVEGRVALRVGRGAAVSVFAPDPKTRVASQGLEWPLDGVKFRNLYCATLNRATADVVELDATRRILVYVPFGGGRPGSIGPNAVRPSPLEAHTNAAALSKRPYHGPLAL